jgi:hypothetical protein
MADRILTCNSFPDLVEELQGAKKQGARLVSAAPDPQLGQAVGFKLSNGTVYRLPLAKLERFAEEKASYPQLVPLWEKISSTDGRVQLYLNC